jgi:hypothetical protein
VFHGDEIGKKSFNHSVECPAVDADRNTWTQVEHLLKLGLVVTELEGIWFVSYRVSDVADCVDALAKTV